MQLTHPVLSSANIEKEIKSNDYKQSKFNIQFKQVIFPDHYQIYNNKTNITIIS